MPVVGWAYRGARAGVYKAKGNDAEVRNSLSFDLADELNPIKHTTNCIRACVNMTTDYSTGIWIGRAGFADGKVPISCSLLPGVSVEHWVVMINGKIFEVMDKKTATSMVVESKRDTSGLQWTLVDGNKCSKSEQQLEDKMNWIGNNYGYDLVNAGERKLNCQGFCIHMIAYA